MGLASRRQLLSRWKCLLPDRVDRVKLLVFVMDSAASVGLVDKCELVDLA